HLRGRRRAARRYDHGIGQNQLTTMPTVVFATSSDSEASVVMALLDSQGIPSFRASGHTHSVWPMAVSSLGEIRIAVADDLADEARRIIESHRQEGGAEVARIRAEVA